MTGFPWNACIFVLCTQNKQPSIYIARTADEYSFSFLRNLFKMFCIIIRFVKYS